MEFPLPGFHVSNQKEKVRDSLTVTVPFFRKEVIRFRGYLPPRYFQKKIVRSLSNKKLSGKEMVEVSKQYLYFIGKPNDAEMEPIKSISMIEMGEEVKWCRKLNGYKYYPDFFHSDYILMQLSRQGTLLSYRKRWLGTTCKTEVKISRNEAINNAIKIFNEYVVPEGGGVLKSSANLYIVRPNTFWRFLSTHKWVNSKWRFFIINRATFARLLLRESRKCRLAWVITLIDKETHRSYWYYIDAETGRIIGGDRCL